MVVEMEPPLGKPSGGLWHQALRSEDAPRPQSWRLVASKGMTRRRRLGNRGSRGGGSYPCAVRGPSVYPNALACFAIALTLRSWYCAS